MTGSASTRAGDRRRRSEVVGPKLQETRDRRRSAPRSRRVTIIHIIGHTMEAESAGDGRRHEDHRAQIHAPDGIAIQPAQQRLQRRPRGLKSVSPPALPAPAAGPGGGLHGSSSSSRGGAPSPEPTTRITRPRPRPQHRAGQPAPGPASRPRQRDPARPLRKASCASSSEPPPVATTLYVNPAQQGSMERRLRIRGWASLVLGERATPVARRSRDQPTQKTKGATVTRNPPHIPAGPGWILEPTPRFELGTY